MQLGAGLSGWSHSGAPHPAHSAPATGPSSWFSWFQKGGGGGGGAAAGGGGGSGEEAGGGGLRGAIAGRSGALANGSNGVQLTPRTEQEEVEVEVIRRLVDSYFCIVRRNVADAVPKAIMHFMVNHTKRGLQQHLIQQLYRCVCL
jgi:hypothetical protein